MHLDKLEMMCRQDELPPIQYKDDVCIMEMFAQYVGDWSCRHRDYRWQLLPGGDHTALGDCLATLRVLKGMGAGSDSQIYGERWEHL